MKGPSFFNRHDNQAITLIETLVVLVAMFVLLAMLVPVRIGPRGQAKTVMAHLEAIDIVTAVEKYREVYGRFPVPTNIEVAALVAKDDFTYGGPALNAVLGPGNSTPENADLMAILMDLTNNFNGAPTANSNHNLNPQRIVFLSARFTGNTRDPGVGNDLVYRDPWGHPYVISMDLNGDSRCRDAFYKNHLVSRTSGAAGFDGMTNYFDASGASDLFEHKGGVMAWSFGPDGKVDKSKTAITTPNKDNIVSWQ